MTAFHRFVIATRNEGKVEEMRAGLAPLQIPVLSLREALEQVGVDPASVGDPVEDADTFEGNARIKALEYAAHFIPRIHIIADDSGLEVDALDGAPGVYSARYAGESASDEQNNRKLLQAMAGVENRSARFRCVIACCEGGSRMAYTTDGACEGTILRKPIGEGGFGYDPLFMAEGQSRSMAELSGEEKLALSHRGKALRIFRAWHAHAYK